jgi:hypothetical protein
MVAGKTGGTPVSPYVYDSGGDYQGNRITITIPFNTGTLALLSATVHRDPNCMFTRIAFGVGGDGHPESSPTIVNVGKLEGDRAFTAAQLASQGLTTLTDIFNLGQITALT